MQPILQINLSNKTINQINISRDWEQKFLGGASLAARILYKQIIPELDPLAPEAPLLFLCGPLTGTAGPAVGRFVVCAKSPATGLWGESNCGGFWGPELRMAGYDGLMIIGKADSPVYITIIDQIVKILPAEHLWGLDTYSTQVAVKAEMDVKNPRVAVIGPAGESQIPFAVILTDHGRVAGRTGMGSIMGSKNLKAVAVKGTGKVPVADKEKYAVLRSTANIELKGDSYSEVLHTLGTAGAGDYFDYLSEMPKRYFQQGVFEGASKTTGASVTESILVGTSACHACVIACGRVVNIGDGIKRKGPEYETLAGFGPNLLFDNLIDITKFGELCDRYGMDTISMSNTIGMVFSLKDKGILSDKKFDDLYWGNPGAIERLIHQTINKEGIGEWIAKGSLGLGKHFNCEDEAVQVNGLEIPYHDPRGGSGMALVYATSPRGACHNQSDYFIIDIGQVILELGMIHAEHLGGAEKSRNVAIHQNWRTIFNALVACVFANIPPDTLVGLVNAACGLDWTSEEMMRAGERGWNLKRAINNRLGLTSKNDTLPKALLKPYTDNPPAVGRFVPEFDSMIQAYYEVRGWDPITGYPTKEKLLELGLDWVGEDLW